MIAWRTMRILFLITLLILGIVVFAFWLNTGFLPDRLALALPQLLETPSPTPFLAEATPIVAPRPLVNPVLTIAPPAQSIFAPPAFVAPPVVEPTLLPQF